MRIDSRKLYVVTLLPVLLAGCHHEDKHTERATIDDEVQSVSVDVGSGDLTLRGRDVTGVAATARVEGDTNHLAHVFENGHLALFDDCNDSPCSVDITATVPFGVPIEISTGSGDVELYDLLGTVSVSTGSGDVGGFGLAGADLVTTTGSGDVDLEVTAPAERVYVRTGSGDVRLDVPSGAYALYVDTGSGDTSVRGVSNDSGAPASLEVTTGSGDVTIRGH